MRPAKIVTILVLSVAMTLAASAAWAGLDNPNALDVATSFADSQVPDNGAYLRAEGAVNSAVGAVSATANAGDTVVAISWHLYEPEKVTRSSNKAKLQQKKYGAIDIYTYMYAGTSYVPTGGYTTGPYYPTTTAGTTYITTAGYTTYLYTSAYLLGEVEKCKLKADAKSDKAGSVIEKVTWKVSCNDALATLNVPAGVRTKLEALLGGKDGVIDVEKDKIDIKGQCKDAACLVP
jgi:hypothetical protein